jgi:antitoxin HicB
MRDLDYYKGLHYKLTVEYDREDDVYYARFPELSGCVAHGKSEQEALEVALKVKDEWLSANYDAGWEIPEPSVREETTGRVTFRMPKYLHRKVIERADEEGVSLNQIVLSFVAQGIERSATEDQFKKLIERQDETIKLLQKRFESDSIQAWVPTSRARSWMGIQTMRRSAWSSNLQYPSADANTMVNFEPSSCEAASVASSSYPVMIADTKEGLIPARGQQGVDPYEQVLQGGSHEIEGRA